MYEGSGTLLEEKGRLSGLSNTNKLIFYYDGATGLKTGFTSKAMYCLSATAERDGAEYIAVVLHAATSAERFDSAKALLSYAFANYELASLRPPEALPPVRVVLGRQESMQPVYEGSGTLLEEKGRLSGLRYEIELAEAAEAPIYAGQKLGTMTVYGADEVLTEVDIVAPEEVERLSFRDVFLQLLGSLVGFNG